jgi:hypothetical protein
LCISALQAQSVAQQANTLDIEVGARDSHTLVTSAYYVGGKYAYWLNPHFAYSFGGGMSFAPLNESFHTYKGSEEIYYSIDSKARNLYATLGIKLSTNTLKRIGLEADADFQFEPLPFNFATVEKSVFIGGSSVSDSHRSITKLVFTYFNPCYNLQISVFYKPKKTNAKLALGCGFGNYNYLNTYYRTTIDNVKLSERINLRPKGMDFSLFIRLSNISL